MFHPPPPPNARGKPARRAADAAVFLRRQVRGFYLRYESDPPNEAVRTWNVRTLSIPKNARFGDRAMQEAFWGELDNCLGRSRSNLVY